MSRGRREVAVTLIPKLGIGATVGLAALLAGAVGSLALARPALAQQVAANSQSGRLNAQGMDLYKAGKVDDAIAAFRQAVAADPRNSEALTNLGLALDSRGQDDEAVEHLDRRGAGHAVARRMAAP